MAEGNEGDIGDLAGQLLALLKINDATSSARLAEMHGRSADEQKRLIAEIKRTVRELLDFREGRSHLYKPFEAPLTGDEYVLPAELEELQP